MFVVNRDVSSLWSLDLNHFDSFITVSYRLLKQIEVCLPTALNPDFLPMLSHKLIRKHEAVKLIIPIGDYERYFSLIILISIE